jgi:hypothetical protein
MFDYQSIMQKLNVNHPHRFTGKTAMVYKAAFGAT